jgi:hypothetical protein
MKTKLLVVYTFVIALFAFARPVVAAPTDGLVEYLDTFTLQKPYDLNISDRFSATNVNGLLQYTCWVKSGDNPLYITSGTQPRTEMRWNTNWNVTERMWEADVFIDSGTDNQTAIMQVKSNNGGGEPIYITVNGGNLYNTYGSTPIATNIIGRWFHMICAYNPTTGQRRVWIDGTQVVNSTETHPLSTVFYFKNGTYHVATLSRVHFQSVRFWSHDQTGLVQMPSFTPLDGTYSNAQLVSVWSPTPGASIRYTLDGSTPSATSGTLYNAPILISSGTTITAIAFKSGMTTSGVNSSVIGDIQSTTPQVASPVFSADTDTYDTPLSITMSSATSGATIRYTTDGSIPTQTHGTLYSGTPVNVSSDTTLQALAYKSGQVDSKVAYAFYLIAQTAVADPVFSPPGGTYTSAQSVSITTATSGASIRYTVDGSAPTSTTGTLYTGPVSISSTTTLKAIAFASGLADSAVVSATYTINFSSGTSWEAESLARTTDGTSATNDTDSAASGGVRVTLNATGAGSWMQFTLPNVPAGTYAIQLAYKTNNNRGQASFLVDGAAVGGTLDQYASSGTYPTTTIGTVTLGTTGNHTFRMTVAGKNSASSSYTLSADKITLTATTPVVAPPTFNPPAGTYTSAQTVAISTNTSGASIRYTTDGSTPSSTVGTLYSGPITISSTTTVRAIAYASGMTNSSVSSATYTISPPTLSWEAESLTRTTSGTSATNDTDSAASGGVRVTLNATGTGSWMQFTLPNVPAGTYSLQLAYKTNNNRGQSTFLVDGAAVGGTLDQYAASSSYPTATIATITIGTTGNHTFRMTVSGKNSASSSYTLSADKITLVPQ